MCLQVVADLAVAEGREGEYTAGIYEFPVDFRQEDHCHAKYTGRRPLVDLAEVAGPLVLPSPEPILLQLDQVTDTLYLSISVFVCVFVQPTLSQVLFRRQARPAGLQPHPESRLLRPQTARSPAQCPMSGNVISKSTLKRQIV
jgi:hypothetical protein